METGMDRVVVSPAEGDSVWLGGLGVVFKIAAEDTGGTFSVVEHPIEAGRLVPPHVHTNEDECSFVLAGQVGARVGDREILAGRGSYIYKPRGVPHTFWNPGPKPARILEIILPAGFERFFRELGALADSAPEDFTDFERQRASLARNYGTTFVPSWEPVLKAKYDLTLIGE